MRIRNMHMRVTSQRLNTSKRKAGLSAGRSSLFSRLGQRGGTSRLSAPGAASSRSAQLKKSSYAKLEKSADALADAVSKLMAKTEDGTELGGEAEKLAEEFNGTLKLLKQADGMLNEYYRQSLKEISTNSRNVLEEIGITVAADGTLSVNKEKLGSADGEKVKRLLGSNGDFAKRVGFVASRVADNAAASAQSVSGRYNAGGELVNSYLSRYNVRG